MSDQRAPVFFDDAIRDELLNLGPTRGDTWSQFISQLNFIALRARPLFSFWGGGGSSGIDPIVRQRWQTTELGAPAVSSQVLLTPVVGSGSDDGNRGVNWQAGGQSGGTSVPSSTLINTSYPFGAINHTTAFASTNEFGGDLAREVEIGSRASTGGGSDGPKIWSGCVYEKRAVVTSEADQIVPTDFTASGAPIIGGAAADARTLAQYRKIFLALAKQKRPHFGWCCDQATGGTPITLHADNRYLFDTRYGDGSGHLAPSLTGPGINIPLKNSAIGLRTTIRVYVSVLAKMSGTTDHGTLSTFNRSSDGSMTTSKADLTHGSSISGTTWTWYPAASGNWSNTDPYFDGNATAAYDHVVLCGRSSGSTDTLKIAAVTLTARHSTA